MANGLVKVPDLPVKNIQLRNTPDGNKKTTIHLNNNNNNNIYFVHTNNHVITVRKKYREKTQKIGKQKKTIMKTNQTVTL